MDGIVSMQSFDCVHAANILCIAYGSLPASLFRDDLAGDSPEPHHVIPVIATGSSDKTVRLMHAFSGKFLANIFVGFSPLSIDFHPSCSSKYCTSDESSSQIASTFLPILLVAGMDGSHHILNVATGESLSSWKDHTKYIVHARFSPDAKWIATASYDRSVNLYKAKEGEATSFEWMRRLTFPGCVESLAFIPTTTIAIPTTTASTLIVGSRDDHHLHFIQMRDEEITSTKMNMNQNNDSWVSFVPMDISVDPLGRHVAVYTDASSGRIAIFALPKDIVSEAASKSVEGGNTCNNTTTALGDVDSKISLLKPFSSREKAAGPAALQKSTRLRLVTELFGLDADAYSRPKCMWSPSEPNVLFATSDDGAVIAFNVARNVQRRLEGHTKAVRALASGTVDGFDILFSISFDLSVRVWASEEAKKNKLIQS